VIMESVAWLGNKLVTKPIWSGVCCPAMQQFRSVTVSTRALHVQKKWNATSVYAYEPPTLAVERNTLL
jgi:hypothetical protein